MARAGDLYRAEAGVAAAYGAVQLESQPKDASRFRTIAGSDLFAPGSMICLSADETGDRLGEVASGSLRIAEAMVIEPAALLSRWLGETEGGRITSLGREAGAWRLMGEDGAELALADIVCVSAGMASLELIPATARQWTMTPVRGQSSFASGLDWPIATLFGGYAVPLRGGVLFGATHDRDDTGLHTRGEDEARNLAAVMARLPQLGARLSQADKTAWVGVRASTPDYIPIAGAASAGLKGLFILSGLGSRGFCLAPLLGEHIAALALGSPSPLPGDLAAWVDPARFETRARRRGRVSVSESLHTPA
jgi:tRNA 5-methylaminomethyl-2-thiouridine biosynthesis bifunctional protein